MARLVATGNQMTIEFSDEEKALMEGEAALRRMTLAAVVRERLYEGMRVETEAGPVVVRFNLPPLPLPPPDDRV